MRARLGVLVGGLALASLAGCHRRSSESEQPAPAQDTGPPGRHFPGVEVIPMTGGRGVWIRAVAAVAGSGPPLYVVDGAAVRVQPGGGIEWLYLEQIVNVEVLKDPARTAVYGPRGANGVIVITTKVNP